MLSSAAAVLTLLLLAAGPAAAQQALYADAELQKAAEDNGPRLKLIVSDIPRALPRQRRLGTAGIGVAHRLRGEHPLAFYSDLESRKVVVPWETVVFIRDLATVFAWFEARACRPEYIYTYLWALLGGGQTLPAPLKAFGIDRATALSDTEVAQTQQAIFDDVLYFLLAHEVGHLALGHTAGLTGDASQAEEIAAVSFALDYFEAYGWPPLYVHVYFLAARSLDPTGAAIALGSHPVTPDRLRAVADRLIADQDIYAQAFDAPKHGQEQLQGFASAVAGLADDLRDDAMVTHFLRGGAQEFPLSDLPAVCPA